MSIVGHNNPPGSIEFAQETAQALSDWMKEHPVIQTEDDAREAKVLADRAKDAEKDMENERTALVGPLNEQVKTINDRYRPHKTSLEGVLKVLVARIDSFVAAEEQRRAQAAAEAQRILAEAEAKARAAENAEREAADDAAVGVTGIDVAKTTQEADAAFELYKLAEREARRAERDTKVKIGGGFRRALTRKTKETLEVTDWHDAIAFLGLTDRIKEAILTEARAFRQEFEELPPGITPTYDRSL